VTPVPPLARYQARHLLWRVEEGVAYATLDRPERKNPLTFDSYAELRDLFLALEHDDAIGSVLLSGSGGNFSSGGDVHEIIAPLLERDAKSLLAFTRMTGSVVKAMRACPQPIVAAIEGVCAGAGAMLAAASDLRLGSATARVAFLFNRVGLAGADMGACALLPRIIGQGRAAELLFTGRFMLAEEAVAAGFLSRIVASDQLAAEATSLAQSIAAGPRFANAVTKRQLAMEWAMDLPQAIEAEALAQALCMETQDFRRAYEAFLRREKPVFRGD